MKILKNILIVVAVLFAMVFIFSLFLPSKYHVERSIVINSPADTIFSHINNLRKWNDWIPFNKDDDSTFKITYGSIADGVGASQQWEGKKLGIGTLVITKSETSKLVEFKESFGNKDFESIGTFNFDETTNGIKITWQDEGPLGFNPISRIFGRYYDKLMGKDFEKGLQNLKKICEKN